MWDLHKTTSLFSSNRKNGQRLQWIATQILYMDLSVLDLGGHLEYGLCTRSFNGFILNFMKWDGGIVEKQKNVLAFGGHMLKYCGVRYQDICNLISNVSRKTKSKCGKMLTVVESCWQVCRFLFFEFSEYWNFKRQYIDPTWNKPSNVPLLTRVKPGLYKQFERLSLAAPCLPLWGLLHLFFLSDPSLTGVDVCWPHQACSHLRVFALLSPFPS